MSFIITNYYLFFVTVERCELCMHTKAQRKTIRRRGALCCSDGSTASSGFARHSTTEGAAPRAEASIFHPAGCWQAAFHVPSAVRGAVLLGEITVLPVGDPGVAVRVVSSLLSVGLHRLTPSSALGTCMSLRAACRSVT